MTTTEADREAFEKCSCGVYCQDTGNGDCRYTHNDAPLPTLPFPRKLKMGNGSKGEEHFYDEDQIIAYGRQCAALAYARRNGRENIGG